VVGAGLTGRAPIGHTDPVAPPSGPTPGVNSGTPESAAPFSASGAGSGSGGVGDPGGAAMAPAPPSPSVAAMQRLLLGAAVGLLLLFILVGFVLFDPETFTEKLITFGVAAALTVWIVTAVDGAQRRTIERMRLRMEMQRRVAVAEAIAEERGKALNAFLESFVANVNSSIGQFPPHVTYAEPYEVPPRSTGQPGGSGGSSNGARPSGQSSDEA
jgi:hypothetical protein